MASDLSLLPNTGISTQLCGDAHLANFGLFATAERRLIFDLNDFDETLPGPFEWDVMKAPARRQDSAVVWEGRDRFLDQAPVREGDFFHVPRIIARDDLEMEEEE